MEREPAIGTGSIESIVDDPADGARQLFRYLGGEEWRDYRAILRVFADTFFAEFAPDEVAAGLATQGIALDGGLVADRLESLRRWGNLTTSSSIGNPASLDDYYRRRHRYLITRAGQQVHDLVEGVLDRVDDVGDVQAGRLRDLHRALLHLTRLLERGLEDVSSDDVVDAVRGVFDPHEAFSTEMTQFFASINQWQSRFDLEAHEIAFFAEVLVGYVSEQLVEIERMSRPIATSLRLLHPHVARIAERSRSGLAARVEAAGMSEAVSVRHVAGSRPADWDHLTRWFGAGDGGVSRLDALTRQAVAAVRTLTGNLTRLSRVGAGAASRRADFTRLARFVDEADELDDVHELMAAAFGLYPSRHLGLLAADAGDPVARATTWADAPRAEVPLTLRERGERTQRGRASPLRDRSMEREVLRRRRDEERRAELETARELLDAAGADGHVERIEVSTRALRRLQRLLGSAAARRRAGESERRAGDPDLVCLVRHVHGASACIVCPEGVLDVFDTDIRLVAAAPLAHG